MNSRIPLPKKNYIRIKKRVHKANGLLIKMTRKITLL